MSSHELLVNSSMRPAAWSVCRAFEDGNLNAVKKHVAAGALISERDEHGLQPIHYASGRGHLEDPVAGVARRRDR